MVSIEVPNDSILVDKFLNGVNHPIIWNHPHLSLFVSGGTQIAGARLSHFHANPIFSRWQFTLVSSLATRLTICGIGVS